MAENELVFKVSADTKKAETAIDAFGNRIDSLGKKAMASLGAYLSFKALAGGIEKAIDAAKESEASLKSFNSALQLSGKYSEEATNSFQSFAETLEQTTGVQDDIILKNSAMLVSLGKLSGEGLKQATSAALDLSKGMGIDVGSAFDVMTKAATGNVSMLTKYGLEVRKGATDSEKFAAAIGFINDRFGGLAAGSINTFEGALKRASNGMDKMFEELGTKITKDPKSIAALILIGDAFYKMADGIKKSSMTMGSFIDGLLTVGKIINDYILRPLEWVTNIFGVAFFEFLQRAVSGMAIVALAADKMFGTNHAEKLTALQQQFKMARDNMVMDAFSGSTEITDSYSKAIDETKKKLDELAQKIEETSGKTKDAGNSIVDTARKVEVSIGSALAGGITSAIKTMAKNLAEGKAIISNFGRFFMGIIGEMAVSVGTVLISTGLGMLALGDINPFAAIAAGIGLVAIGTILSTLSGGETQSSGAAGAGSASGGYNPEANNMTQEQERITPQTGVQVVVNGNIFDNKESALQIAQLLNDSFDLSGTLVRANA